MNGAIHINRNKIKLRSRPWHFKLRPNVADHLVARYNAGIFLHMPGGLEEMPLPRPRNFARLNSLQGSSGNSTQGSSAAEAARLDRGPSSVSVADSEDGTPQVCGRSAYGAYGTVYSRANELQESAVKEARDVADALHLTKQSEQDQKPDGLFGSFRRLKRSASSGSDGIGAGWTMWHTLGCVAMHRGVKDESSDEDESVHAVHTTSRKMA